MRKNIVPFLSIALILSTACTHEHIKRTPQQVVPEQYSSCDPQIINSIEHLPTIGLIKNDQSVLEFFISPSFFKEFAVSADNLIFKISKKAFNTDQDYESGTREFTLYKNGKITRELDRGAAQFLIKKDDLKSRIDTINNKEKSNISFTGGYTLEVSKSNFFEETSLWKMNFFINTPYITQEGTDFTQEQIQKIAEAYAPILSLTSKEEFHPSSLEYIFKNQLPALQNEFFHIDSTTFNTTPILKYFELSEKLPWFSQSNSVLKVGKTTILENNRSGETNLRKLVSRNQKVRTVYYSTQFLNDNDIRGIGNLLAINYHLIYPFDYKNSDKPDDPVWAAHAFDRESMTILLKIKKNGETKLDSIVYGAHLATQKMALINPLITLNTNDSSVEKFNKVDASKESSDFLQTWLNGRLMVLGTEVNKTLSVQNHPIAMLAQGSHGVYPVPGKYAVLMLDKTKMLVEEAGGEQLLLPEPLIQRENTRSQVYSYQLKPLIHDEISACSYNSILNFSGSFVDVEGIQNATFPPFTDREMLIQKYLEVLRQDRHDFGVFKADILENAQIKKAISAIKTKVNLQIKQTM